MTDPLDNRCSTPSQDTPAPSVESLIERAINAHDDLVEALVKVTVVCILHHPAGESSSVVQEARAVLAKAGAGQ